MSANQPGVRIGALRGVPVYLGRSWFLIAVVVVLLFGPQVQRVLPGVGLGAYVVAGMYVLLLLVSVLVHEAAHALVGQARGYDVEAIVADLWGGHTSYRSVAGSPTSAALVAVVGPLSNLVLAGLGYLLLPHTTSDLAGLLLVAFVYANAFVGFFNLLPGLPLDGGHLVDALVWRVTGSRAAGTRAAGWCGRIVVLLIVGWFVLRPFVLGGRPDAAVALWVLFICGFLWLGAGAAVAAGGDLDLLASVRVGDVLRPAGFAPLDLPVERADVRPTVVLDPAGAPVGIAATEGIRVARQNAPGATLASVTLAQPAGWVVPVDGPDADVTDLVRAVNDTPAHVAALLVTTRDGRPLGLVDVADLEAALHRSKGAGARK